MSATELRYDYTEAFCEHGLDEASFAAVRARMGPALAALRTLRERPEPSFLAMPEADLFEVTELAASLSASSSMCLVLGIGGSSLGAKAVYSALVRPESGAWRDGSARRGARLVFLENVDPVETSDVLESLVGPQTIVNVVTKSGTTVETMGSFFAARARLLEAGGPDLYRSRVVATTDPSAGILRGLVDADGLTSLPVPPGVGGRFSVFTPVGTFPLAMAGVDVAAFLRGAGRARDAALDPDLDRNPAAAFAAVQIALLERGVHDVAFMPYVSGLRDAAAWFVQLWAESLGKLRDGVPVGPTPIPAVGATDQHSQLQLFMEGPATKNVVFVETRTDPVDVTIPTPPDACASLGHLGGKTFGQVRAAELAGVRAALAESARPSSTLSLPDVSAESLGELLMTLSCATGIAGSLLGVNPYDQPGVELAKLFAHGLLGRPGAEEYVARFERVGARPRRSASS